MPGMQVAVVRELTSVTNPQKTHSQGISDADCVIHDFSAKGVEKSFFGGSRRFYRRGQTPGIRASRGRPGKSGHSRSFVGGIGGNWSSRLGNGRGSKLGMADMGALLVRWRMDEAEVRRRMYRAPTPRERERWRVVWLLTRGWTAAAVGRALEPDAHTIAQWARAFAEGGLKALVFEQTGGSPRVGRGATRRAEVGGAAIAVARGHRAVQLELADGAPVCGRPLRVGVEPEQLPELSRVKHGTGSASAGVCAETAQEAVAQSGPGTPGSLCGGVCRCYRCGPKNWNQAILRLRGALSGRR